MASFFSYVKARLLGGGKGGGGKGGGGDKGSGASDFNKALKEATAALADFTKGLQASLKETANALKGIQAGQQGATVGAPSSGLANADSGGGKGLIGRIAGKGVFGGVGAGLEAVEKLADKMGKVAAYDQTDALKTRLMAGGRGFGAGSLFGWNGGGYEKFVPGDVWSKLVGATWEGKDAIAQPDIDMGRDSRLGAVAAARGDRMAAIRYQGMVDRAKFKMALPNSGYTKQAQARLYADYELGQRAGEDRAVADEQAAQGFDDRAMKIATMRDQGLSAIPTPRQRIALEADYQINQERLAIDKAKHGQTKERQAQIERLGQDRIAGLEGVKIANLRIRDSISQSNVDRAGLDTAMSSGINEGDRIKLQGEFQRRELMRQFQRGELTDDEYYAREKASVRIQANLNTQYRSRVAGSLDSIVASGLMAAANYDSERLEIQNSLAQREVIRQQQRGEIDPTEALAKLQSLDIQKKMAAKNIGHAVAVGSASEVNIGEMMRTPDEIEAENELLSPIQAIRDGIQELVGKANQADVKMFAKFS